MLTDQTIDGFKINTAKQLSCTSRSLPTTPSIRKTYEVLCSFINMRTFSAFPKITTLAKKLKLSTRQVLRNLAVLKNLGVIETQTRGYLNHLGLPCRQSNMYTICLDKLSQFVAEFKAKKNMSPSPECHLPSLSITDNLTTKDIDLDSISTLKSEAKAAYQRLSNAVRFKDFKDAWQNRGRRYIDEETGGIFIHSSHKTKPSMLIGYILGSPAHQNAELMMKECQKILK